MKTGRVRCGRVQEGGEETKGEDDQNILNPCRNLKGKAGFQRFRDVPKNLGGNEHKESCVCPGQLGSEKTLLSHSGLTVRLSLSSK